MKKIVYILSSNYSGSHLLSLVIGSHTRFQHIGEVKGLRNDKHPERQICGICDGHENCPVLGGISTNNLDNIYDIIFSNVDKDIIGLVDTSKKTFWAERFLNDNRYEKKFVFLVRDPRALARRWLIDEKLNVLRERLKLLKYPPRYMKMGLFGDVVDLYVGKWLQQNWKIINFINKFNLDSITVTYHDLIMKEKEVLTDLMNWIGETYEPGQEEYWNFKHHGSSKTQYKDTRETKLDCRWKEFLNLEQQEKIANNSNVQEFLRKCGIEMNGDGLTLS